MTMLRLGRVDRVRIQVGYREAPESAAHDAFLLDLPVAEGDDPRVEPFDTQVYLAALEPVLYVGSEVPRHYSLHQHQWHTSWAPASGAVDLGLTVTTGDPARATTEAATTAVTEAFRSLLGLAGVETTEPLKRQGALVKGRRGVASAYGLDEDSLSLVSEEFHAETGTWRCSFRTRYFQRYAVTVGFVDRYPGSVRVRREGRDEVTDSVGTE
jgi:hypothetical protein